MSLSRHVHHHSLGYIWLADRCNKSRCYLSSLLLALLARDGDRAAVGYFTPSQVYGDGEALICFLRDSSPLPPILNCFSPCMRQNLAIFYAGFHPGPILKLGIEVR